MSLSIETLTTPLTPDEVFETFLSILETLSIPARSWRTGGTARTILRVVATSYAGFTVLSSDAIRAGFLETSTGNWLTILALNVYGVTRRPATFATGEITFTNLGGGVFDFAPGEVTAFNPTTKKTYVNVEQVTLGALATASFDFRAVESGAASSSTAGGISSLETTLLRVTVSNAAAFAGSDDESDAELRQKCRDKLAALSPRGPRGAYDYAASVALRIDGTPVDINRRAVVSNTETGVVTIYCASPTGAPTVDDLERVRLSIEDIARPDSVTAVVASVVPVALATTIVVWATRTNGVSESDIALLVANALIEAVKAYPISGIKKPPSTQGYLYGDFIVGVAKNAHPSIFDIDGSDEDLPLNGGEVATLAAAIDVRLVAAL